MKDLWEGNPARIRQRADRSIKTHAATRHTGCDFYFGHAGKNKFLLMYKTHCRSTASQMSSSDTTKVYLPLPPPDNLYAENPQAELAGPEKEMYDAVFNHFTTLDYRLPGFDESHDSEDKETHVEGEGRKWTPELIEEEKFWLSHECIRR